MFFNQNSTTPTSSSFNNNNNPNQLNPNSQPGILPVPANISNHSLGGMPPQLSFGSTGIAGGGLFGNPQPSGSLFGNNLQHQQPQGGGDLLGNQVQQQSQGGSLFGGQVQQQFSVASLFGGSQGGGYDPKYMHTLAPRSTIPSNGTIDYIGRNRQSELRKNKDGHFVFSMTAKITGHSLDEHRMVDYFNFKNKTLSADDEDKAISMIRTNSNKFLPSAERFGSLFVNSSHNAQTITLFGGKITRGAITDGVPSQMALPPMTTNNTLLTQSSSLPIQASQPSNEPIVEQTKTKKSSIKTKKPAKSVNITSGSNPGLFSYEFNKMLFVSSLVQIMEKHNMSMPENLLDNTDFVPQLLEFLGQHNISLPTENVPQFQIGSTPLLTGNEYQEE